MSKTSHSKHYDEDYFLWQKTLGEFGGKANSFKFRASVNSEDTILDFGCGGGFLLNQLTAKTKIGIEPNLSAHTDIRKNGSDVYSSSSEALKEIGPDKIDTIISNNALEHCLQPFEELKNLYCLLKKGGRIHFLVPCDQPGYEWRPNDRDFHLYSWSPMNIGNLFTEVGFDVIIVRKRNIKWPPNFIKIKNAVGWRLFMQIARVYGMFSRKWVQIEIIATKK